MFFVTKTETYQGRAPVNKKYNERITKKLNDDILKCRWEVLVEEFQFENQGNSGKQKVWGVMGN